MSAGWSGFVMLLIVVNLGITLFLFLWGPRVEIPTQPDGTSGHTWAHGVLREGVRKLPTWWIVMSAALFVSGFGYLALYPGFGAFGGLLGWTSHDELARNQTTNDALVQTLRDRVHGKSIEAIAQDPQVLRVGQVLFIDNCAACHGREATGNPALGAPDLTDHDSLYGGDGKTILASILDGRRGAMPAWGATLSEEDIGDLTQYVTRLSGRTYNPLRAQLGKRLFSNCMPCHGSDGKGNQALGAPDLTDDVWLYGGRLADISATIRNGRSGTMPAWRGRLSDDDAAIVAAWVYSRSNPPVAPIK